MPTYEYRCNTCKMQVVEHRRITENRKDNHCPVSNCTGELLQVYNSIGVSFNGSGFYSNDKKIMKGD